MPDDIGRRFEGINIKDRLRDDWRATRGPTKVVLTIVGAVYLLWGTYMALFVIFYRF